MGRLLRPENARIAQLVEHITDTDGVLGSNPSTRTFNKTNNMKSFLIGETVAYGWKRALANWKVLSSFILASYIANLIIQGLLRGYKEALIPTLVLSLVSAAFGIFAAVASVRIGLAEGKGDKATWRGITLIDMKVYGNFILVILMTIAILAAIGLASYLLSFIVGASVAVPIGILVGLGTAIRLRFATYAVVDGKGPVESIKASLKMTEGCFWQVLGLTLLLVLVNIAGAIAVFVGLLITVPLSMVAMGKAYQAIK